MYKCGYMNIYIYIHTSIIRSPTKNGCGKLVPPVRSPPSASTRRPAPSAPAKRRRNPPKTPRYSMISPENHRCSEECFGVEW